MDSGATISVVDTKQIKLTDSVIRKQNVKIHTANGSILNVEGKMKINISFQNIIFPLEFILVTNLAGPALLGTDFLSKYRVQLDFFNRSITMYKNINCKINFNFEQETDCQPKNVGSDKIETHNTENNNINMSNSNNDNKEIKLLKKLIIKTNDPKTHWWDNKETTEKNNFEINNITHTS